MLQKEEKATAGSSLESQDMQTHVSCVCMHTCMQLDRGSSSCAGTLCLLSPAAGIHTEILLLLHCFLKEPSQADKISTCSRG